MAQAPTHLRDKIVPIRMTEAEHREAHRRATALGVGLSELVRTAILGTAGTRTYDQAARRKAAPHA